MWAIVVGPSRLLPRARELSKGAGGGQANGAAAGQDEAGGLGIVRVAAVDCRVHCGRACEAGKRRSLRWEASKESSVSIVHVRQIQSRIRELYENDQWVAGLDCNTNLSRLLARYVVDVVMPTGGVGAAIEITHGQGDRGIDAIGVDPEVSRVVMLQSKSRDVGPGFIDLGSVLKFADGPNALLDLDSEAPAGFSEEANEAVRRAMSHCGGKLSIALITTAVNDLTLEVRRPLDHLLEILNEVPDTELVAEVRILTQGTAFETLSTEAREAVTLELQLLDWGSSVDPCMAYYVRVRALEIANGFEEDGDNLFKENLRIVLPRSEINDEIYATVTEDPENFCYYNNEITVLASARLAVVSAANE